MKFNDSLTGSFHFRRKEASNAGVNTLGPQREKTCRDFPLRFACLGQRPQTPLNAEFHSAAARSANALDHDRLTAGRGLFPVLFSVPHPFSAAGPHWLWPSKAPAFLHGSAGTRRRFSSFLPAAWHTRLAGP